MMRHIHIRGWKGLAGAAALAALLAITGSPVALAQQPFVISVDGERVDGSVLPGMDETAAEGAMDIQVKFDGLGVKPVLNVSTVPPRATYKVGDEIKFLGSLNYASWIERAEIRISKRGIRRESGIVEIIELENTLEASWTVPADAPKHLEYVLRVYDAEGRFDETLPLPITIADKHFASTDFGEKAAAPGYSDDRTGVRNIEIAGGAVTVYGKNVPEGHQVFVAGEQVPVDAEGSFVVQRVFPSGSHSIAVRVEKDGEGLDFNRPIEIPENEWFYLGLADFTAGYRLGGNIEAVSPGEFEDKVYTRGRLAFYLKGKIKGRYILTAAADTGEQRLKSIFKGLDEKDPRQFLKRLDPDDYYPVYGDDSTSLEDAPTSGKFYVKLEKGPSHVMWGNFKSNITGTHFLRHERALYGAQAKYHSNKPSPEGGAATELNAHAALPGTLPQRLTFRGTGGSAYFMKHQDITPGSETVTIEKRNAVTGWVISRTTLRYGVDYDFDYVQGVIILRRPLPSSDGVGTENYLVVNYEFTPAAREVDGYVLGGRAQQWLGEHVRVGVSALRENTDSADQVLYSGDIKFRTSDGTYVEAEVAQSEGPGFGSTYSPDGGLTLQDNGSAGAAHVKAKAWRVEGQADLEEISHGAVKGKVAARYEEHEKGFSSPTVNAPHHRVIWGVEGDIEVSEGVKASASYSDEKIGDGRKDKLALGKIRTRLSDEMSVEVFGSHTSKDFGATATATTQQGTRSDAGIKLLYAFNDGDEAYVYGQKTITHTGTMKRDDRVGVGGTFKASDKVTVEADASIGTQGPGASLLVAYEPTSEDRYYLGYQLDPTRDIAENWPFQLVGQDLGTIVVGARHRFNEHWLAYAEDNFDAFGDRLSLTQIYGVEYTPVPEWTVTAGAEFGRVYDKTLNPATGLKNPDFDRNAISVAVSYKSEDGFEGRIKGEWRSDDSEDDTRDMMAYLLQASLSAKTSENWRALASLDAVWTDASESTRDGKYVEGSLGYAYRPAEGDRLNALLKYTYLLDEPGQQQVGVNGSTAAPFQRSHIFSADVNYDLTPQLTLGAKYGMRIGETKERDLGALWEASQVHLAILRADFHLVHELDLLLEGRVLWSPTADDTEYGAVAAVYKHLGPHLKLGLGYNFGSFSDDLRDLTYDDHGVFLNVIGKF